MANEKTIKSQIGQNLIQWFEKNKRDLPWRKTKEPYKIWVSEIMLQQTRVDTVIAYYNRFMERFPTVQDLAIAEEQEVLRYWQGLGYYSRARNLYKGAKMVCEQFNGEFPSDIEQVKKIPGIGPYTAGAILSIAFNEPTPAVDGNVLRVFSRIFAIIEDIAKPQTIKMIQQKVKDYMPIGRASSFTEGLMELGALICIPISPLCLTCPLFEQCKARQQGIQEELPIKTKKIKPKKMHMVFCVIRSGEEILIVKNKSQKLLKGMWGFPGKEGKMSNDGTVVKQIIKELGIQTEIIKKLGTTRHIFTHMDWDMHIYLCEVKTKNEISHHHQWIQKQDISKYPFPKVYQKTFEIYLKKYKGLEI